MVRKSVSGFVLLAVVLATAGIGFNLFMGPATGKLLDIFNGFQGMMKAGMLLIIPIGVWFLYKGVSNAV